MISDIFNSIIYFAPREINHCAYMLAQYGHSHPFHVTFVEHTFYLQSLIHFDVGGVHDRNFS